MLELYHWEPNGAGARVLITLEEKGLAFESRYVDVMAFEQHAPAFLALNETGETPVLVHDGEAFNESSYICEYLEERFPETPLMPATPFERWRARYWQKVVDDHLGAYVADLAWSAYGARQLEGRSTVEARVAAIPSAERRGVWQAALAGVGPEQLDKARGRVDQAVARMEEDLKASGWLAGGAFSLADIAVWSWLAYAPRAAPDLLASRPLTTDWLQRVGERPGVKAALARARTPDPYAVAAPGPEHIRWG